MDIVQECANWVVGVGLVLGGYDKLWKICERVVAAGGNGSGTIRSRVSNWTERKILSPDRYRIVCPFPLRSSRRRLSQQPSCSDYPAPTSSSVISTATTSAYPSLHK